MEKNDGLWIVEFGSSEGLFGRGIFVLDGERILGGDLGYYYSGHCKKDNDRITGKIDVIRFDRDAVSVFGEIDNFTLTFEGAVSNSHFTANAKSDSFPKMVMEIKATKKVDL